MLAVIKTILILILELFLYYVLGTVFGQLILKNRTQKLVERVIVGFLIIQVMFQVCALPFIYFDTTLTFLTKIWCVVIAVALLVSVVLIRKRFAEDWKELLDFVKKKKLVFFIMNFVVVAMCYYVSINGEQNDDAVYYIGLISTTLSTDSMYRFNVYTGEGIDSLYLRRALSTFDIHTATICKVFDVHPLIVTRIGRASLNVILTAAVTYLLGLKIYWKEAEDREKKSCILVALALFMNFLFMGNIYTSGRFLITRAYEGKAFSANVLVLFTIYICIKKMTEKSWRDYMILLLVLWASIAVSSSGIAVNLVTALVCLVPYYMVQLLWGNKVKKNAGC